MKKSSIIQLILLVAVMVAGASTGTYFVTKHIVFADAYSKGKSQGYKTGYGRGHDAGVNEGESNQKFLDSWNTKASSSSTPVYIQTSPTHCFSSSYGIDNQFSSTNCY